MKTFRAKHFGTVFAISLAVHLTLAWWLIAFDPYLACAGNAIIYFGLTWMCLEKFKDSEQNYTTGILTAIILGRIIAEVPIRISDFTGSMGSLMITVFTLVTILLSAVCHKERNTSVYALTIIVEILLISCAHHIWLTAVENHFR